MTKTEMLKRRHLLLSMGKLHLQVRKRMSRCFAPARTGHSRVPRYQEARPGGLLTCPGLFGFRCRRPNPYSGRLSTVRK